MGERKTQNRPLSAEGLETALQAEGIDLDNRDYFVQDDEFLEADGSVPVYVENCTHPRLDTPPAWDVSRISACKDCGQMMVSKFGAKDKSCGWLEARGRVTLPVTIEKMTMQMFANAAFTKPYHDPA